METFNKGYQDAITTLGIEKVAVIRPSIMRGPGMLKSIGKAIKTKLPTRAGIRNVTIGDPRRVKAEFEAGGLKRLFRKGDAATRQRAGIFRESMQAPDMLSKALFYGLPAVEAGSIAFDDKEDKGRRIGETLGGAALGAATWKPLGMLGAIALDPVGRGVGGAIGSLGDAATNIVKGDEVPQPQQHPYTR